MLRILIAGEAPRRRMLDVALRRMGMDVTSADGPAALRTALDAGVHLAVIDFDLGDLTAVDFLVELRDGGSLLPVIVLVPGRLDADGRIASLDAGADDAVDDMAPVPELVARIVARARQRA